MKTASAIFLVLSTLTLLNSGSATEEASSSSCCLCENCDDVPSENTEIITVSPFGVPEGTTCSDLAQDILDIMEGSDRCTSILKEYRAGCCVASMEEESLASSFLRGARRLWGSNGTSNRRNYSRSSTRTRSSSGVGNGGCTYQPVGVNFNTQGGNFGFSICKNGRAPQGVAGATVMDPSQGRKFSGSCQQLNQQALNGYMSNNMCGVCRLRLDAVCCSNPEYTQSSLAQTWRVAGYNN